MPHFLPHVTMLLLLTIRAGELLGQQSCPISAIEHSRQNPTDYSSHPAAPYVALEVTVATPQGHTLAGTLTLPKVAASSRRVPAVITISGSGCQTRDGDLSLIGMPDYRPFRQLADSLGRRGIAVLRLDDRGYGGSGGEHNSATSADFAEDVRAGLAWLRARGDVDPARVALLGHSEGGIIAQLAAIEEPELRAVALLASPAKGGRAVLEYQLRNMITNDATIDPGDRPAAFARIPAMIDSMEAASRWMAYFLDYEPLETARQVEAPVFVLNGGTDQQVTPEQAEELAAAFRTGGNADVTLELFPDLNHLFMYDPDGTPWHYAKLSRSAVEPEVLGRIVDWLVQRLE